MNKYKRISLILVAALSVVFCLSSCMGTGTQQKVTKVVLETKEHPYSSVDKGETAQTFEVDTDFYRITFDTEGASVRSMMLKNHANADGQFVDIVFKGDNDRNAFLLYWGDDISNPVTDAFAFDVKNTKNGKVVVFTKDFRKADGSVFTLTKTFEFRNGEYLFAVDVDSNLSSSDAGEYSWTIAYEPQVGPSFQKLSNGNYDYRKIYLGLINDKGSVKSSPINYSDGLFWTKRDLKWISLTSKYFTAVAYPENQDVQYKYQAMRSIGDITQTDSFYISVPSDSKDAGRVYFYCGPQLKSYLGSYYNGSDNAWGLWNVNLDDAMESGSALGWLETILKWCLKVLYKIVPNYGVDIIILTVFLKLVMFPLNNKSMKSTAKMSTLQPQVQAIQAKYPDNPQKQNAEMQQLYKENGVSMMGGCLPMLLQFPILIAFYGLLNKHFELRGAMFIPGWITDLSVPETIATLPFNIPLLGNQLHLLPILYTASMIFSMKLTQSANTQNAQNKSSALFMTYGMPIMFFFILYSSPSGLLLYWSVQNVLGIVQQIFTNRKMAEGKFKTEVKVEKKEPEAILRYREKLKKAEEKKGKDGK